MAGQLPSGVVTFLFSDIEGSTRLLRELGASDYTKLQDVHRGLMRSVFATHNGVEVNTEGDSFFVAFASAIDAVRAALASQLELSTHDWGDGPAIRVRIGVHTGEAVAHNGDYTALAVNSAARISSVAHGGQTLVSAATHQHLADVGDGTELRSLGSHRLKDLGAAIELFQLCHHDLRDEFPPPNSLDAVANNLPIQLSSFVGRETELADIAKSLTGARLVTLVGPGGMGKTRLALQAAAEALEDFEGGIWVAELAAVSDDVGVSAALLSALGLREEPGAAVTDTIIGYLRDRRTLVIVDNCEQVIAPAAALVQALLAHCPKLRVLATSREALRISGEVVYQVPGLGLPAPTRSDYLEALAGADAVRLFVARATDVGAGFALTADNAADIAAVCTRLDGLPLAIELAASRSRSLTPRQLNERLGRTLDLLSKGARNADARQSTLRATIEWSHQLLSEPERVLFRRLAIFIGGWRLEAAEQVCPAEGLDADAVLDVLDSLVDKSLVAVGEDDDGEARYRLLETIRAYATERLAEAGESDTLGDRHAAWCSTLALDATSSVGGSIAEAEWFDRLQSDHGNLLAGLAHLRGRGDAEELPQAGRLGLFWLHRGHWRVGHDRLHRALGTGADSSPARAKVLGSLGAIALGRGEIPEARVRLTEALAIARDLGDRGGEGKWIGYLGNIAVSQGDYAEGKARFSDAIAIARELGDRRSEGTWIGTLGIVARQQGDYPEARARYAEAIAIARDLGDRRSEGNWIGYLGNIAASQGDYPEARARYTEALAIARELGDRHQEGLWIGNVGDVEACQGDYSGARAHYTEALAIVRDLGDRWSEGHRISNLGVVASRQGNYPEAQARCVEALIIARDLDLADLSIVTVESVAVFLTAVGLHSEAMQLAAWAHEMRRRSGAARDKADRDLADELIDSARTAIGDEALELARRSGAALSATEAFDLAERILKTVALE